MNYISVENLTKTYGIITLFENISFNINEGDKIAIVAKNGSGKSTLLKILMGRDFADSGEISINKDIQVVLFDQEIDFEGEQSVQDFMKQGTEKPKEEKSVENPTKPKKKLSFKEQKELELIEKEMPMLETERDEILAKLNNETDYSIIAELSAILEEVSEKLDNYEMRWLELQEIIN